MLRHRQQTHPGARPGSVRGAVGRGAHPICCRVRNGRRVRPGPNVRGHGFGGRVRVGRVRVGRVRAISYPLGDGAGDGDGEALGLGDPDADGLADALGATDGLAVGRAHWGSGFVISPSVL